MTNNEKIHSAYKTIGEVAKELNLINQKTGNLKTYTIRYWETQFKQIRPKIRAGKRRYYSTKDIAAIKKIIFLLKEKGMTINGVKKLLDSKDSTYLDVSTNIGVYKPDENTTKIIKDKIKNISKIIKDIKNIKNG
jgi:DNA-binding transcriptional MerR regulator